jgi:hypothetical protein
MTMNNPRTGQRFPMKLPVEIQWKSPAGSLRKATGKTRNISGGGLFIEIPIRLRRATSITIKVVLPPDRKPNGPIKQPFKSGRFPLMKFTEFCGCFERSPAMP